MHVSYIDLSKELYDLIDIPPSQKSSPSKEFQQFDSVGSPSQMPARQSLYDNTTCVMEAETHLEVQLIADEQTPHAGVSPSMRVTQNEARAAAAC